jgi:hypothetical protein
MKIQSILSILAITCSISACSGPQTYGEGDEFIPSENPATSEDYTNSDGVPIDTNTREYITGLTIGQNFSNVSDAGESGEDICIRARDERVVVSSSGYAGVDPKTASFLLTDDGMQGCIDGFYGIPQE